MSGTDPVRERVRPEYQVAYDLGREFGLDEAQALSFAVRRAAPVEAFADPVEGYRQELAKLGREFGLDKAAAMRFAERTPGPAPVSAPTSTPPAELRTEADLVAFAESLGLGGEFARKWAGRHEERISEQRQRARRAGRVELVESGGHRGQGR